MENSDSECKGIEVKSKEGLIQKLREKLSESGLTLKNDILNLIANSSYYMSSIIGNELIISTFIPMIPSLMFDEIKRKIFEKEVSDMSNRIFQYKDRFNMELVLTLEGRSLFQQTFTEILEQTNKDKIELHKALLINVFTIKNPNMVLIQSCFETLKRLNHVDITILKIFSQPAIPIYDILASKAKGVNGNYHIDIVRCIPDYLKIPKSLFESSMSKLQNEDLIKLDDRKPIAGGFGESNYTDTTELEKRARESITRYGSDFLHIVTSSHIMSENT